MSVTVETGDTVAAALSGTRRMLQAAGIDSAALDARLLVAVALGITVETVIAWPERSLTPDAGVRLAALMRRRVAREPMAYILGRREFWSLDLVVTPATLTPRPDSETLVAAALDELPDRHAPLSILDFGTGTGCLLLALLSELPAATGTGVDIDRAALDVARQNAFRLGLTGRTGFMQGEWGLSLSESFDVIVSNPPYIATGDLAAPAPELRFEPRLALDGGADGLSAYRALIPDAARLLRPDGLLVLEIGAGQAVPVQALLAASGLTPLRVSRDLAGVERCVLARARAYPQEVT